ncbi:MAG: hypothetical protein CMK59_13120 [Proteobacteria bacterium]|nr:hypothetical protein [Pseudomonadota bacterium]
MWKQCLFNRTTHRFLHTEGIPEELLSLLKELNSTVLNTDNKIHFTQEIFLVKTHSIQNGFWTTAALLSTDDTEHWRFLCHNGQVDFSLTLPSLVASLKKINPASSLTEINIESSNLELPQDWLTKITPILTMLMSGQNVVILNDASDFDDTVALFTLILSTMPSSLCWRMDIQIGGNQLERTSLAYCNKALYGTPIKLPWQNENTYTNVSQARKHPKKSSLYLGEHYIVFLNEEATKYKQSIVLKKYINHHFGPYARIKSSDENSFPSASSGLTYTLLELPLIKDLKESFLNETPHPKIGHFDQLKKEALKTALRAPLHKSASFILLTLSKWPQAWLTVQHYPLAQLLCAELEPTQKMLQWITQSSLPETLVPTAQRSLEQKLHRAMPSAILIWKSLFSVQNIPWLSTWVSQNQNLIFDYAFKSAQKGHPELLSLVSKHPLQPVVQQLEDQISIDVDLLLSWFQSSKTNHKEKVLSTFIDNMIEPHPLEALKIIDSTSLNNKLTKMLLGEEIFKWDLGPQTAKALVSLEKDNLNQISGRILLAFASHLSESDQEKLFQKLSLSLRTFYGAIFLGKMTLGASSLDKICDQLFQQKYSSDPDFARSVLPRVKKTLNKESGRHFIEYFLNLLEINSIQASCPVSKILLAIRLNRPLPALSEEDEKILNWVLRLNEFKPEHDQIHNLATLRLFVDCLDEDFNLTEDLLLELFSCSEMEQAKWTRTMHRHSWENLNGWRIFKRLQGSYQGSIGPISYVEDEACKKLPNSKLLILMCSGVLLSDHLLNRLAEDKVTFHLFKNATALQFDTAYKVALTSSAEKLQLAICKEILKKIKNKEDLEVLLEPKDTSLWEDISSKFNNYWFKSEDSISPQVLKLKDLLEKLPKAQRDQFLQDLDL